MQLLNRHANVGKEKCVRTACMVEARRAEVGGPKDRERGVGFLGRGQQAPSHQLGSLGSAVSSPNGVRGGIPAEIKFGAL